MTATSNYIAVRVDAENNAEQWWDAVREAYPDFATSLSRNGAAVIRQELWHQLAALPGFSDGPAYAKDALIDCGYEGDQWGDVVSSRHSVFDSLS
jgi:hypothetical protein